MIRLFSFNIYKEKKELLDDPSSRDIGSFLIKAGIKSIRATDCPFVIVIGHENYYPQRI